MDNEEFLRLVNLFFNEQYDSPEEEEHNLEKIIISYSDPPKPKPIINDKVVDLTNTKPGLILDQTKGFNNIKVGNFLMKIQRRNGSTDIIIYETIREGLLSKVDIFKDTRFSQNTWSKYFNSFKIGKNIPENEITNVIRWLQAIEKLSAFI